MALSLSVPRALCAAVGCLLFAAGAQAGIHTWDVAEVFSNADGTIQFVELLEVTAPGPPDAFEVGVGNGTISSDTQTHTWANGAVTGPTNQKRYLIATADFAALPGAPTPDVILPPGKVPFFDTAGDSVDFVVYDTCTFASVPTDGVTSLNCETDTTQVNSPTNYAGATGSVNAAPAVPGLAPATQWLAVGLILAMGSALLWARRLQRAA